MPVGSTEQHGPHLPFNTDLLIAERVATAAVERVGDEAARIARTVQRLISTGVSSRMRLPVSDLTFEADLAIAQLRKALDAHGKGLRGAKVLMLGVAYKKDIADYRESSAIKILELLQKRGVEVTYHDPFVPRIEDGHGVDAPRRRERSCRAWTTS